MTKTSQQAPSATHRAEIAAIAESMTNLIVQTALYPLQSMLAFNKAEESFNKAKQEAYLCCSVIDTASTENKSRANKATMAVITEMIHLKNDATDLIESEPYISPK